MTVCPSTTVTGVVMTPSFSKSANALASVVMSRSANVTPFVRRNSFVRAQNIHPGWEYNTTVSAIQLHSTGRFSLAAFGLRAELRPYLLHYPVAAFRFSTTGQSVDVRLCRAWSH